MPAAANLSLATNIGGSSRFCRAHSAIRDCFGTNFALPRERMALPPQAKAAIIEMLPDPALFRMNLRHRVAGLGNLGKPRLTAIAHWQGGPVAREAKRLTLSAAGWAHSSLKGPYYSTILVQAFCSRMTVC